MEDKKMNQFTTATDGAYIYAEASNGSQVRIPIKDIISILLGLIKIDGQNLDMDDMKSLYVGLSGQGVKIINDPFDATTPRVFFVIPLLYGWFIQLALKIASPTILKIRVFAGTYWTKWESI